MLGGWLHASLIYFMDGACLVECMLCVCLVDECTVAWWTCACLIDWCMLDGYVHAWWLAARMVDELMLMRYVHVWRYTPRAVVIDNNLPI